MISVNSTVYKMNTITEPIILPLKHDRTYSRRIILMQSSWETEFTIMIIWENTNHFFSLFSKNFKVLKRRDGNK